MLPTIATGNVGSALAGEYEVANSLRFDDGSSDNLTRTPSSNGNKQIWTWSGWVKKSGATQWGGLFQAGNNNNITDIYFFSDSTLTVRDWNGSSLDMYLITNRLFRDVSAWMHIVVAVDTTQGTASNRVKIYVNGTQETSFSTETYPSQNLDTNFNDTSHQNILGVAYQIGGSAQYYDGYMAEVAFIDGQQLDPTSFGEFDEDTGIWKPIDVSGLTFGTNGFYLDFENSGSLGADVSGNGNNFTVNNLTSIDQTTDTCTNNFSTLSPLYPNTQYGTFSDGNNTVVGNSAANASTNNSTLASSQGKWYMEYKIIQVRNTSYPGVGMIGSEDASNNIQVGTSSNSASYRAGGTILTGGSITATINSFVANDIIGIAMDLDNGAVYFSKNGTWENSGDPTSGSSRTGSLYNFTPSDFYHFSSTVYQSDSSISANFGNPPYSISSGNSDADGHGNFEYAVPSGYYALNTKNLAEYG